jgi:hypothetical protein
MIMLSPGSADPCCLCWLCCLLPLLILKSFVSVTLRSAACNDYSAAGCFYCLCCRLLCWLGVCCSVDSAVCRFCWIFCLLPLLILLSLVCHLLPRILLPTLTLLSAPYVDSTVCCLRWLCCLQPTLTLLSAAYVDSTVCCLRWLCCPLPTLTLLSAAYVDSAFCCLRWLCCLLPTLTLLSADFLESCSLLRVSHAFSFESFYPTVSLQYSIISCFCHCVCLLCELSYSICFLLLLPGLALGLVTLDTKSGFSHLLFFPLKVKHWRIDSFLPLCVQLSQLRI